MSIGQCRMAPERRRICYTVMQIFLTEGQGQHSQKKFHSRRGGTCPEPIPIVFSFTSPAISEELPELPQDFALPDTPEPRRALRARRIISMLLKISDNCTNILSLLPKYNVIQRKSYCCSCERLTLWESW